MRPACTSCRCLCHQLQPARRQRLARRSPPNRFYAYGVVARLALLAAAVELERTD
jgi:hypothetical protein